MKQLGEDTAGSAGRRWAWLRRPLWIFIVAFILRAGVTGTLMARGQSFWRANEPSWIAAAMVRGHGFSSAFHDSSGPTAWLGPVYPALLACIFRFFGIKTVAAAAVAILLNVIFSSLTAVVLVQLGREQLSEKAGIVAGWAWAMAPPLLLMPWVLWETCLSGLTLAFAFMMTLRLGGASRAREWAWCGAIWSFAALLNPALLAALPVLVVNAARRSQGWKYAGLMIVVCIAGVLPWTARNFLAFGKIIPVRSNFWAEFYFGNVEFAPHPTGPSMLYQHEGEMLFVADLKQRAVDFVRSKPKSFARLTAERIVSFWAQPAYLWPYPCLLLLGSLGGLVQAWRRGKRWLGFAAVFLFYPLIYYITYTFARYRYPIEPFMYALGAYFVCEVLAAYQSRRSQRIRAGNELPG
jgi:hypothetical protein